MLSALENGTDVKEGLLTDRMKSRREENFGGTHMSFGKEIE